MKFRQLADTGVFVSELCLGAMTFGGKGQIWENIGGLDQTARQAGLTTLPLEIWIDADQRVRKLSIDLDAKQPGTDASVKASLVVELYDYGTTLDLQLPPADQVADIATLKQTTS